MLSSASSTVNLPTLELDCLRINVSTIGSGEVMLLVFGECFASKGCWVADWLLAGLTSLVGGCCSLVVLEESNFASETENLPRLISAECPACTVAVAESVVSVSEELQLEDSFFGIEAVALPESTINLLFLIAALLTAVPAVLVLLLLPTSSPLMDSLSEKLQFAFASACS